MKTMLCALTVATLLLSPASVLAETWHGEGETTVTCGQTTYYPFYPWDGTVVPGNPNSTFSGTWGNPDSTVHGHFTGFRVEATGAASGTWKAVSDPNDLFGGTWAGTFSKVQGEWEVFSGTWEVTWANLTCVPSIVGITGTWWGNRTDN